MNINNIDRNRYQVLISRYEKFRENMSDADKEVIKVFDPLPKKHMEELMLIRQVSQELNNKLREDLKKAAAQAAAEKAAEKEKEEEKSKENAETKTSE